MSEESSNGAERGLPEPLPAVPGQLLDPHAPWQHPFQCHAGHLLNVIKLTCFWQRAPCKNPFRSC